MQGSLHCGILWLDTVRNLPEAGHMLRSQIMTNVKKNYFITKGLSIFQPKTYNAITFQVVL